MIAAAARGQQDPDNDEDHQQFDQREAAFADEPRAGEKRLSEGRGMGKAPSGQFSIVSFPWPVVRRP